MIAIEKQDVGRSLKSRDVFLRRNVLRKIGVVIQMLRNNIQKNRKVTTVLHLGQLMTGKLVHEVSVAGAVLQHRQRRRTNVARKAHIDAGLAKDVENQRCSRAL